MDTTNSMSLETGSAEDKQRDRILSDLRSSRRLDRIVASMRNFLDGQIDRIEETLRQFEASFEKEKRLRRRLRKFQKEKKEWNEIRKLEIERLSSVGDELAIAWEELETERRKFLDSQKTNCDNKR